MLSSQWRSITLNSCPKQESSRKDSLKNGSREKNDLPHRSREQARSSCTEPMLTFSFSLNMRIQFLLRGIILLLAFLRAVSASGEDPGPLRLEKEISLPEVEGRIDHFSADEAGQRLFIAALENGSVEIVDVRRGERTAEIKGLKEPQGVYYDGKNGRLFVATGGDGKLRIYDGKTLVDHHTLALGADAPNIRYNRQTSDLWVGYGNGGIGIVNSTGQRVGSVELGTHPESFQFEERGNRAYRKIPTKFV